MALNVTTCESMTKRMYAVDWDWLRSCKKVREKNPQKFLCNDGGEKKENNFARDTWWWENFNGSALACVSSTLIDEQYDIRRFASFQPTPKARLPNKSMLCCCRSISSIFPPLSLFRCRSGLLTSLISTWFINKSRTYYTLIEWWVEVTQSDIFNFNRTQAIEIAMSKQMRCISAGDGGVGENRTMKFQGKVFMIERRNLFRLCSHYRHQSDVMLCDATIMSWRLNAQKGKRNLHFFRGWTRRISQFISILSFSQFPGHCVTLQMTFIDDSRPALLTRHKLTQLIHSNQLIVLN